MSEKKEQHYIPACYLRNFSYLDNKKDIGLFVTNSKLFCINAPLKKQARKSFFYGKDGVIEEDLKKIENLAAPLISTIIKTNGLPKRESDNYLLLLLFVFLSELRTPLHPQKNINLTKNRTIYFMVVNP